MSDKKESSLLTVVVVLVFIAAVFVYNREPRTPTPGGTSTNVVNPTHVQFESLDHDTVTRYEIDVINAAGTVEQTIVLPKASTLVQAAGVEAPLKLYPLTPGTYRLAVRAQVAVAAASGTSPDGTRVPPAPNIVDAEGAVWTLAADGLTVNRNGQNAGGRGMPRRVVRRPVARDFAPSNHIHHGAAKDQRLEAVENPMENIVALEVAHFPRRSGQQIDEISHILEE